MTQMTHFFLKKLPSYNPVGFDLTTNTQEMTGFTLEGQTTQLWSPSLALL
jgi:hypothetical protein